MYVEVPTYYTWTKQKSWIRRKQGKTVLGREVMASDAIGRVYTIHLRESTVTSPHYSRANKFVVLRFFQARVSTTYQETC